MATPHIDEFINAAIYFIGLTEKGGDNKFTDPRAKEMKTLAGMPGYDGPWCACLVSACIGKAGATSILKRTASTSDMLQSDPALGATVIAGPYINGGVAVVPERGDIITFGNNSYHGMTHGNHVGLVEYVDDKVHTIEGNSSNKCQRREYAFDCGRINAYIRPNWAALGDTVGDEHTTAEASTGPLYEKKNDRNDMTIREVCYLDANYALSDRSSKISISLINYTTMLGTIYDAFAPATVGDVQVDISQLPDIPRIIVGFLLEQGYTASSACAIAGGLYQYSKMDTAYVWKAPDGKYLYGIGAWTSDKYNINKGRGGTSSLGTDLTMQLNFLNDDLITNYTELAYVLKSQSLDEAAVGHATELFMKTYNKYFADNEHITKARASALDMYGRLIITYTEIIGGASNIYRDINGNILSAQYCVDVPDYVPQTGIIDDFTSYSHWYSKWNKRSPQKKLANLWGEQGFCCDKGVATIGGYYCAAVRPKFGRCGEVIEVTLEDGMTFPVIICDEKGEDAGSEWGHVKAGGNISLIEWERVKTVNGKVITSGTTSSGVDTKGYDDWWKKKVRKITNYGAYTVVGWS